MLVHRVLRSSPPRCDERRGLHPAAPGCSGIRLLPWQRHTSSHSSGILLILSPADTRRHTPVDPLCGVRWSRRTLTHTRTQPTLTSSVQQVQAGVARSVELSPT